MRTSTNQNDAQGNLLNGFDYVHQAWVKDGRYVRCGHPDSMACDCFGRTYEGMTVSEVADIFAQAAQLGRTSAQIIQAERLGHPNTYGDILTEGKCWDALPLSIRRLICSQSCTIGNGIDLLSTPLKQWSQLSETAQASLYRLDWHEIYSRLGRRSR